MVSTFGFLDLGAPELLIILFIALLLFGSKKLPELSRGLGESMHELRKGMTGKVNENKKETPKENNNS
jgi:sec-independent protein translocase protein TatA